MRKEKMILVLMVLLVAIGNVAISQESLKNVVEQQQVLQFSVDSRGRATKATWDVKDVKAIAKTQMTDEYGQTTDVAIAYSKIDSTNMKVEVYGLENGQLSEYPWFEITFKKQKE